MQLTRCPRKPRWSVILTVLGLGWVLATSITAFGMYMVACHTGLGLQHQEGKLQQKGTEDSILIPSDGGGSGGCSGKWTVQQGQLVLVVGSLLNIILLLLMLALLILERRSIVHPYPMDPPPDYDNVIKEETPPPSFSDLLIPPQPTSITDPAPMAQPTPSKSSSLVCVVITPYPPPYTA